MTVQKNNKIYVFDTNIFLTGIDFNLIEGPIYTTFNVLKEIEVNKYKNQNRTILNRILVALAGKKLILRKPSIKYMKDVEKKLIEIGDVKGLSRTDKELIALSLELKNTRKEEVILYTNDYSMENLCLELDISFSPLYKSGVRSKKSWEPFCPYCNITISSPSLNDTCERCGHRLKRKEKKP